MGGVVNILVRQVKSDDLAVAGVNANVQLAPSAALCRAMFFKRPFAGPAQFQSGAVDDQVKFARSNPHDVANRQSVWQHHVRMSAGDQRRGSEDRLRRHCRRDLHLARDGFRRAR